MITHVNHNSLRMQCKSCHNNAFIAGVPQPHLEYPARYDCDACHDNSSVWAAGPYHNAIQGMGCTDCHNGREAEAPPRSHTGNAQQCQICHTTRAWLTTLFNHNRVLNLCVPCHVKDRRHPSTSEICQVCHNQYSWLSFPVPFNHRFTDDECTNCHNGVIN